MLERLVDKLEMRKKRKEKKGAAVRDYLPTTPLLRIQTSPIV